MQLAIAVHFKVSNFCSYVTLCPNSYVEDFPVQNNIPEHLVRGYTWPFPTAFVLFFVGQINTDIADTSLVSHFQPLLCQVRGPHYSPAALNIQDFLALRITLRAEICCVDPRSVIQWTWYANKYFLVWSSKQIIYACLCGQGFVCCNSLSNYFTFMVLNNFWASGTRSEINRKLVSNLRTNVFVQQGKASEKL